MYKYHTAKMSEREHFEAMMMPEPNSGCWIWLASSNHPMGYGEFTHGLRQRRAHRASWEIYHGPIPAGMFVLHRCDCGWCVNPTHLFLGTQADNMDDMKSKGRDNIGSNRPLAKITEEQAIAIYLDPRVQTVIGAEYGIAQPTVGSIKRGKIWKHATAHLRQAQIENGMQEAMKIPS